MSAQQLNLDVHHELIIDNFAGGGGASTGIELALGRRVDIAINHDAEAVAMHSANHPETRHFCESVWEIDPREVTQGRPVGLVWLSPDCKHFSKAKGGKPVEKKIRGLAWVAIRWASVAKPRVIMLENVEEFVTWGPLGKDGRPCPQRKGKTFDSFVRALNRHGYAVEYKELRACDFGAPTIRKRLFLIARRDGQPIVWPTPTHGAPHSEGVKHKKLKPWRTAAECIDWSIPAPSIFERSKPLAEATCRRIAKGIMRYVVNAADPFIVKYRFDSAGSDINAPLPTITAGSYIKRPAGAGHAMGLCVPVLTEHANASSPRCMPVDEPLRTICAQTKGGHHALIAPTLIQTGYGERPGQAPRVPGLDKPLGTLVGSQKHALVAAFMAKHYGGVVGHGLHGEPLHTVTSSDHNSLVTSNLVKLRNNCVGQDHREPLHTITGGAEHFAEVRTFLIKYYGTDQDPRLEEPLHTVTTKDRYGLVTVAGEEYQIADIGLRMLAPRELFKAQGFPDDYIIGDDQTQGLTLTKTAQVRMCGNSVCPPVAAALVRANLADIAIRRVA